MKKIYVLMIISIIATIFVVLSLNFKFTPKDKSQLIKLINKEYISLEDIDVSNITDMSRLFLASSRKDFSGIENWNVSNVVNMYAMFKGAKYGRNV